MKPLFHGGNRGRPFTLLLCQTKVHLQVPPLLVCTHVTPWLVTKNTALAYVPFLIRSRYCRWGCRTTRDGQRWIQGGEPARAGLSAPPGRCQR